MSLIALALIDQKLEKFMSDSAINCLSFHWMYTLIYFYDWVKVIFLGIEKDFANHSLVFYLLEPMFKFFYLTSSLFLFTELYTCIILLFGIFCIFSMCCRNYSSSCSPSRSYSRSVSRSRSRRRESRSPSIRRRKGSIMWKN